MICCPTLVPCMVISMFAGFLLQALFEDLYGPHYLQPRVHLLTSDYRLFNLRSTALCPTLLGRLRSVQASGSYEHVLPLYVAA